MKLVETERVITAYADGLDDADASKPAAWLRIVAKFLAEFGERSMAELIACKPEIPQSSSAESPRTGEVLRHLRALQRILKIGREGALADELELLIARMESDSGYLSPMLQALRRALMLGDSDKAVSEFVERLKKDTGSDAFEQTLQDLAASPLKREQVVQVALKVYGGIPKKTSRKTALNFIRKPHDARVNARRGIEATGGRSAA